jgi:hypothetical protein
MVRTMADRKQEELDRVLDKALAKYAAAAPRAGLEERVLATVRAERARVPDRAWWRWSVMAALAAMVIVAVTLAWKSDRPPHPVVANRPATATPAAKAPATQAGSKGKANPVHLRERGATQTAARRPRSGVVMAGNPKLDQFPSPRPLSEQEKLLQSYVAEYPERAVLIARARTEALRQDQLEEMNGFPSGDRGTDSDERNYDTTDR